MEEFTEAQLQNRLSNVGKSLALLGVASGYVPVVCLVDPATKKSACVAADGLSIEAAYAIMTEALAAITQQMTLTQKPQTAGVA